MEPINMDDFEYQVAQWDSHYQEELLQHNFPGSCYTETQTYYKPDPNEFGDYYVQDTKEVREANGNSAFRSTNSTDENDFFTQQNNYRNFLTQVVENIPFAENVEQPGDNCRQPWENLWFKTQSQTWVQENQQQLFLPENQNSQLCSPIFSSVSHSMEEEISNTQSPAKGGQNKKRNMPVIVIQRVIGSFKEALRVQGNHQGRLTYLIDTFRIAGIQKQQFLNFLEELNFGNKKTWKVIEEQLTGKDRDCVETLLDGANRFLSQSGEVDFENWLATSRKMNQENKQILRQEKSWFIEHFNKIRADTQ